MGIFELILMAVGLSMDAFAVSICKGLSCGKSKYPLWKVGLVCGIYFGFFQALMPLIGYYLGISFTKYIENFDHWIAFLLLAFLGIKMIVESFHQEEEESSDSLAFKTMVVFAIATSIDALAAGLSFAILEVNIFLSILLIGAITFAFSFLGALLGSKCGGKFKNRAERIGGMILILIGLKILIEHLFF